MGDVGLGDDQDIGCDCVQHTAHELDYPVGSLEVDTGGTDGFPEIGDGIEADELGTLFYVEKEDFEDLEKDCRVGVVEVNLVVAEGGPYQFLTGGGLYRGQEGECAGPDNL